MPTIVFASPKGGRNGGREGHQAGAQHGKGERQADTGGNPANAHQRCASPAILAGHRSRIPQQSTQVSNVNAAVGNARAFAGEIVGAL
jgi:hypothetical protein